MSIKYSIVLTVHNKDWLLDKVINGIIYNTIGVYELIVVLDGCTDKSKEIIFSRSKNINNIKIIETNNVFETRANNAGLKNAEGQYCIIVQDDMIIEQFGWNKRLSLPCEKFDDVWAVSARESHNWQINPLSKYLQNLNKDDIWEHNYWPDMLTHNNHASKVIKTKDEFIIRESVNRGPLLLKKEVLEKADYLDENNDKQDMDDHRLMFKVKKLYNLNCGYFPIHYESSDNWGSTRFGDGSPRPWLLQSHYNNCKKFILENFEHFFTGNKINFLNETRYI
jgi:glycosyltransferase involved in cell wall biosynthesis